MTTPNWVISLLERRRRRKLREAKEAYAEWKAAREEWQRQLQQDWIFAANPTNRHFCIRAAGKEAKYLERVEELMRQPT